MDFATEIKTLREAKNLTQAEGAKVLGISKSALEKWEAGQEPKTLMQEGAIARLAKFKLKKKSAQPSA